MKNNLLVSAAIAGLMATSAFAADKAMTKAPKTAKECDEAKGTMKDGKCVNYSCGAHGCAGKDSTTSTKKTTGTDTTTNSTGGADSTTK